MPSIISQKCFIPAVYCVHNITKGLFSGLLWQYHIPYTICLGMCKWQPYSCVWGSPTVCLACVYNSAKQTIVCGWLGQIWCIPKSLNKCLTSRRVLRLCLPTLDAVCLAFVSVHLRHLSTYHTIHTLCLPCSYTKEPCSRPRLSYSINWVGSSIRKVALVHTICMPYPLWLSMVRASCILQ